ncbi:phosphotransferase [Paenibacillus kandeliae]|uniref:phosphotransferase n=1 Tax=Paenibacillus kandeliae TaxID=3231269 RepID=UPI003459C56D
MNMVDWTSLVGRDGQLNPQLAVHIEIVYTGLHGHSVQRFWLEDGSSYIYKPLPQGEHTFREIRAYLQVMPLLETLSTSPQYPQLLVCAAPAEEQAKLHQWATNAENDTAGMPQYIIHPSCWIVMEDIGVLNHVHADEQLLQIVEQMAYWHRVDVGHLIAFPQVGQKPPLSDVAASILSRWQQAQQILLQLPAIRSSQGFDLFDTHATEPDSQQVTDQWLPILQHDIAEMVQCLASQSPVLLHGDLHAGNYGVNPQGQLILLDWEHSHLGSRFWDLYHLIDLSHPLFPRVMNAALRHSLLERYWLTERALRASSESSEREQDSMGLAQQYMSFASFEHDYLVYAIVYSLWMLLLIQNDLLHEPPIWPRAQLLAQQTETEQHLKQCVERWLSVRKHTVDES